MTKTGPDEIARRERQREVLRLRTAGRSLQQIADTLGISKSTAYKDVVRSLRRITEEPAEEYLTLELQRLDAMIDALWPRVQDGDDNAIDRILKIQNQRAKLTGSYILAANRAAANDRELSAVDQWLQDMTGGGE